MIHFDKRVEPTTFDRLVRTPGKRWLREHPGSKKRPPPCWSKCNHELAVAFGGLCAYTAIHEPTGTVDHFLDIDRDPTRALVYEWSNYRYANHWINAVKQGADPVLDPFEVEDGWFEIGLPSLRLRLTDKIPANLRHVAEYTMTRLHLIGDYPQIRRTREKYYQLFTGNHLSLEGLRKVAPLIARAVEEQAKSGD